MLKLKDKITKALGWVFTPTKQLEQIERNYRAEVELYLSRAKRQEAFDQMLQSLFDPSNFIRPNNELLSTDDSGIGNLQQHYDLFAQGELNGL